MVTCANLKVGSETEVRMEPIKVDEQHALQINLALAKALPTVHADDGASDVISISQRAESALGAIRLPKTLRSGASLMYTHRPNDERSAEVILSRRSEYWYLTNFGAVQVKDQTLKALVLTPKQYDKAFLYNCSWIKIWRGKQRKTKSYTSSAILTRRLTRRVIW